MMKNNYTKRLTEVIEYSREEASRLQNSYIGTEHLMLGILREGEGKACKILQSMNIDMLELKRTIEDEARNQTDIPIKRGMYVVALNNQESYKVFVR